MTMPQQPPSDPVVAALVRAQRESMSRRAGLSRRTLLSGSGALGLGALLAACGTGTKTTTASGPAAAEDRSATEKLVNWSNWTLYLDYDEKTKTYPTLVSFQKSTGIKVNYYEDVDDNETYYGKYQAQLRQGQDIGRDLFVLTDWMANRVIQQKFVQKLNKANIPNWKNLRDVLVDVPFDKGRDYSLTWQSGYAGLAWNKAALKDIFPKGMHSVSDLWHPKLKGRVEVLSEMRDTIGLLMLADNVPISEAFTSSQFDKALGQLKTNLDNGQIRQVKGNSYKEDLISGDALACIAWSGDITQLNFENKDQWQFAIPDSGGTLWSDNMMVPIGAHHAKNAHTLMNYYYDPKVAAQVAAYVNYVCPVNGAKEELAKTGSTLVNDPLVFPDETYLKRVHVFASLSQADDQKYTSEFQKVLGV